jgi:hypothetical protein
MHYWILTPAISYLTSYDCVICLLLWGEFRDRGDNVGGYYWLMVTGTTKYGRGVANPWAADGPAGGWLPEGHIVVAL